MNQLFYGDNLLIMRQMPLRSVDLIYLDPPFNSKQNYNLMYKTLTGKPVPEQAEAFCDTWEMDAEKEHLARTMPVLMREQGVEDYYVEFWRLWIQALRQTQPHLLAYLIYMVQRLLYMKTILKSTGSIYLHCDPVASHYIKVMMDGIFGHQNFRNEIIWRRTQSKGLMSRRLPSNHDVILSYQASDKATWNEDEVFLPYDHDNLDEKTVSQYARRDGEGRRYQLTSLVNPNRDRPNLTYEFLGVERVWRWTKDRMQKAYDDGLVVQSSPGKVPRFKRYLDEQRGKPLDDVWTDIPPISSHARERLGYPTQKPTALLDRIIRLSSREGDVIFDPFCGCGTTVYAAHESNRNWIGCDIAILAINIIKEVLLERYRLSEGHHFRVDGIPASVEQAEELFKHDPFQFQHWAVERTGGFPMRKKVADKGIDGRMYFEMGNDLASMVISVKGGTIRPTDIRDLRGVLEREQGALLAGFICLRKPTKAMEQEAATAGTFEYKGVDYPRIQMLTIEDVLEGKQEFRTPTRIGTKIATGQAVLPL